MMDCHKGLALAKFVLSQSFAKSSHNRTRLPSPWKWAARIALGLFLLFGFAQSGFAQSDPPLTFGNNFLVTGDYVVAGAQGMTSNIANGFATGTITIPDANPGITGTKSVPPGAQIVAALLYWSTVEKISVTPGQAGSGQNGFFRPVFAGGPQTGYAITGVQPGNSTNTVSWSAGGCTSGSTGKVIRTYRADVRGLLPQDANGNVLANGTYEVRLPASASTTPIALGATVVIIYRVLSPDVPPSYVVIYDGDFAPSNTSLTMTQTIQGFYDAAHNAVSRLTHIVGNGKSKKSETVYLNNIALPSLYSNGQPPFPGFYGTWDNTTWTFDPNKTFVNLSNPVGEDSASATTKVVPASSQQGCVSWGAVILSTTVKISDNDGLLDSWKTAHGYCDAAVNEGVCNVGDSSWVDLSGAAKGNKDVFVQLDYMCSVVNPDGTCATNTAFCSTLNLDGTCNTTGGYSFDPRLTADLVDGKNVVQKVVDAFASNTNHTPITLHVIPTNAIPEPTCTDNLAISPPGLCLFPNQPGVVGWPGGLVFLKNQLVDPDDTANLSDCTTSPPAADCKQRFQHGKKDSYHYALFGHALGLPNWTLGAGTLTSAVQSGQTVTFTTSTPHGLAGQGNLNPMDTFCGSNGRVTVAFAITNSNLNGTFCVQVTGQTTFTIQVANSTSATYTFSTDPNLAVASGRADRVSGFSDIGGENSVMALGSWGPDGRTWQTKAGTFMHELGHSLGLTHAGFYFDKLSPNSPNDYTPTVEANCKSNHQSVMNYLFQVDLLDTGTLDQNGNPLMKADYSGQSLNLLNEGTATNAGILTNTAYAKTSWYVPTVVGTAATLHCDGTPILDGAKMSRVTDLTGLLSWSTNQDINFDGQVEASLRGHNDWSSTSTNGLITAPGIDLRQIGATGSMSTAGGQVALGGGGGQIGLGGGGGQVGLGGGGGQIGLGGGGGQVGLGGGGGQVGLGGGGGQTGLGGGGGLGELTQATANSVTRPPRNLTATEGASPRTITLNWTAPSFGQIGTYNIYRSENGAAFTVHASVSGNPPATTFVDTVTCDPGGFRYFVTAVLLNTTQESVPSNTVPASGQDPLTGCYTLSGFSSPAAGASFVQGSSVSATWTVQDDFYTTGAFVNNLAANTLLAIGPFPFDGMCPQVAPPNTTVTTLLSNGIVNPSFNTSTFGVSAGPAFQFTFNWDTTPFNAGCYVLQLHLDSGQVESTALQLTIFVSDSAPHVLTTSLPDGVVGSAYSNTLFEAGGIGAVTWSIVSGPAPPGISFDPNSPGTLSGTPSAPGIYTFMVKVTDSVMNFGTQTLTLRVADALFGDLIVVDGSPSANPLSGTLFRITPTGTSGTIATILTGSPTGVAVDAKTGNIYVAVAPVGSGTARIVQVTRFGALSDFVPGGGVLKNPVAVAVDNSGNVYVGDNNTDKIYKFNSSGTQVDANGTATNNPFASLPSSPNNLQDIRMAFDSAGNLIVASDTIGDVSGQVEVDKIDSTGAVTVLYNTTTNAALNATLTYSLTAASTASGGNTTYTGTFSPVIPANSTVNITGFTNAGNNGQFTVVSCTSTTLVVNNPNGVSETNPGAATFKVPIRTVGGISLFADGSIDVADFSAQALFKITSPGTANMAIMTAIGPTAALCCNISGMANPPSAMNTTLYVTLNGLTSGPRLQLGVPETNSVNTVLGGMPLTFPNDVAWYDFAPQ